MADKDTGTKRSGASSQDDEGRSNKTADQKQSDRKSGGGGQKSGQGKGGRSDNR